MTAHQKTANLSDSITPHIEKIKTYSFEMGPIRPPSEGGSHSLLLRPTRNCSWNRCKFCYGIIFNREKFVKRRVEDIKKDIDAIKGIADELKTISKLLGYDGQITQEVKAAIAQCDPFINAEQHFMMVFNWLYLGAKTVFLQDGNTFVMKTTQLLEILTYLKDTFPSIVRITSYARAKTITKRPVEELKQLRKAGLTRLHVGLETGDDEILSYMDKGVTAKEHVMAGKNAKEAGFELSEYVMIDLGGRDKSKQHAENTAMVLNQIDPDYIRFRPFVIGPDLPIYEDYQNGLLKLSSPHERLRELKTLAGNLDVTGRLCFDHFINSWYRDRNRRQTLFCQDYEGYKFPEQKDELMALIEEGLSLDESVHLHVEDIIGMRNL